MKFYAGDIVVLDGIPKPKKKTVISKTGLVCGSGILIGEIGLVYFAFPKMVIVIHNVELDGITTFGFWYHPPESLTRIGHIAGKDWDNLELGINLPPIKSCMSKPGG